MVLGEREGAVTRHNFAVLHVHDLGKTLRAKGITFDQQCKIFEVCNPRQTANILAGDMTLNMALPCRISVCTDNARTNIGLIKPAQMLRSLSDNPALVEISEHIEIKIIQIVDDAK